MCVCLGSFILRRLLRANREPTEAKLTQYCVHGALGEPHTEFGLDAACEIDTTPAHHIVLDQIETFANHLGYKLCLHG